MAANNTFTSLNALFKQVYADKVQNLVPDGVKLYKMIKFEQKSKLGNSYNQPVILGLEHGVTFAASDDDAFSLNAAVAGTIKNAVVRGNPVVLSSVLGYKAASSAVGGGEKAFTDATKFLVANMVRSITKKMEIVMLYGGSGIGVVGSVASTTLTITTASFASGIWAGAENMPLEITASDGTTVRSGACYVSSVDLTARTITLSALPSGTVATDIIWMTSARTNEMLGIHKILTNTGTLFDISAATYSLWRGNSYAAGGALSLAKIERAIALAVAKGLDSDVTVLVSPATWADLLVEQTALRKFDSSYSPDDMKAGSKAITFYGQNGMVSIEPTIYCKEGFAYVLDMGTFSRVGSCEVTFERPGGEGRFFQDLEGTAGYQLRCFSDQALFCDAPGRSVIISGIVNTA